MAQLGGVRLPWTICQPCSTNSTDHWPKRARSSAQKQAVGLALLCRSRSPHLGQFLAEAAKTRLPKLELSQMTNRRLDRVYRRKSDQPSIRDHAHDHEHDHAEQHDHGHA